MKEKFITENLRKSTGKCAVVHDLVMDNLGVEKMGTCSACGHDIKNHFGIEIPETENQEKSYIWVGSCCAKILCDSEKTMIVPAVGTKVSISDKCHVIIDRDYAEKLGNYIYDINKLVYDKYSAPWLPNFENCYNGAWYTTNYNDFLASIFNQIIINFKKDQYYHLSEKQYLIVDKKINK